MNSTIYTLSEVLESVESMPDESDLFLPIEKFNENTKCAVLLEDENFEFAEETLLFAKIHELNQHFGIQLVQDVVSNAKVQKPQVTVKELIIAFEHYLEYDAFYDFGDLS